MSADNWEVCPKCAEATAKEIERRHEWLASQYGKMEVDLFINKRKELEEFEAAEPSHDMREDYTIGVDGKTFSVNFTCYCTKCKFSFAFKHTVDDVTKPAAKAATK